MSEPQTLKERMESRGWDFAVDYDPDGVRLIAEAMKARRDPGEKIARIVAYHTDAQYENDLAECRAAWVAEL